MNKNIWHAKNVKSILKELNTDSNHGLSESEALLRIKKNGRNILLEEKKDSVFKIVFSQFNSPLIYILLIAGFITLFLQHFTDALIIFITIILNTTIGFLQEKKASDILNKLKSIVKVKSYVIRDGLEKEINQSDLTIGDIIILHAGNKVPADCRVIESHDLKINESALTGEWQSVSKKIDVLEENTQIFDQKNMLFMSCGVESGWGKAVVVEVGSKTEIGKIANLLKSTRKEKTLYQKKIHSFSQLIAILVFVVACLVFITGIANNHSFIDMFMTTVAMSVAAIPEGLAVAITIILALGMSRILEKKGLVRHIVSAETLGSTSVIATDKTGTLTEGNMRVANIYVGSKELMSLDFVKSKIGSITKEDALKMLCLKTAILCSEAFIENPEENFEKWIIRGDPMEKALIIAGMNLGITEEKISNADKEIERKPFDSASKYSAVLYDFDEKNYMLYILGAPEILLARSIKYDNNTIIKLNNEGKNSIANTLDLLASKGQRVVATAYKKISKSEFKKSGLSSACDLTKLCSDLVFSGLIALNDPLRLGIKDVIKTCKNAGIEVIIATGDHRLTAKAIAEEIGFEISDDNIIDGITLGNMTDEELKERIYNIKIYARVEPAQKLRIIKAWKEKGHQIAMTGDGINDAPALKQADIGIGLESGTDIAKEASDLVLLSDDFSIIVSAIREGRKIIDNIKKTIVFMVSECFSEIVLIVGCILFGVPIFILPVQILWENLIEGSPQGISLAFEPEEEHIMKRKPENPKAPLFDSLMKDIVFKFGILTDIILFFIGLALYRNGMPIEEVRTFCFVGLALSSLCYGFSCKNLRKSIWNYNIFSNKWLNLSILFGWIMIILAVYNPFLQTVLKTIPLPLKDWVLLALLGITQVLLIEWIKYIHINKKQIWKK